MPVEGDQEDDTYSSAEDLRIDHQTPSHFTITDSTNNASVSTKKIPIPMNSDTPPAVVLASGGYDHTIRFWDVVMGSCIGTLQHNESVNLLLPPY